MAAACGEIHYRMTAKPMMVHCCHCKDCQRQTDSAFVINALIEDSRLEVRASAAEAVRVPTDSGRPHDVYRCATCRTAVWSDYGGRPLRFVRVGTLDKPAGCRRTCTSSRAQSCLGSRFPTPHRRSTCSTISPRSGRRIRKRGAKRY